MVLLLTTWPSRTCARLLASKCASTNLKHSQVCNKRFKVCIPGQVMCFAWSDWLEVTWSVIIMCNFYVWYNYWLDLIQRKVRLNWKRPQVWRRSHGYSQRHFLREQVNRKKWQSTTIISFTSTHVGSLLTYILIGPVNSQESEHVGK